MSHRARADAASIGRVGLGWITPLSVFVVSLEKPKSHENRASGYGTEGDLEKAMDRVMECYLSDPYMDVIKLATEDRRRRRDVG